MHDTLYDIMNDINNYLNVLEGNINIDVDNIILESKSRDEYARLKFKKKYDFKPDDKDPYKNTGTISVNGEKVPINMGKSKFTDTHGHSVSASGKYDDPDKEPGVRVKRSTKVHDDKNNTITLDKNFFKLKNQKRRDGILYHELTHRKFQKPSSNENMQTPEVKRLMMIQGIKSLYDEGRTDDGIRQHKDEIKATLHNELLGGKKYNTNNQERSAAILKLDSKYRSNNYHVDGLEKEADIGGAKATSSKNMSKAITNSAKLNMKNTAKEIKSVNTLDDGTKVTDKDKKESIKESNKKIIEDSVKRRQSLSDKENKNIDFYNKIMPRKAEK